MSSAQWWSLCLALDVLDRYDISNTVSIYVQVSRNTCVYVSWSMHEVCTLVAIAPSRESHSAFERYPTIHHLVTEICSDVCAHFCYKVVHCWIWAWWIVAFAQRVYCCASPISSRVVKHRSSGNNTIAAVPMKRPRMLCSNESQYLPWGINMTNMKQSTTRARVLYIGHTSCQRCFCHFKQVLLLNR